MSEKSYPTYTVRFFVLLVVSVALLLLFSYPIVTLFIKIGRHINYESLGFLIGYGSTSLLAIIFLIIAIVRGYIPHKNLTYIISIVLVFYLFLRFDGVDHLELLPLNNLLKYLDIIILLGVLYIVLISLSLFKKKQTKSSPFFLEDNLYEEGEIANEKILQKLIITLKDFRPSTAFSVGINAVWGYGKSTFLKRFKIEYEKREPKAIVFWYRVWKNKGVNAIIENFFHELSTALRPLSGELDTEFKGYVDAILKIPHNEFGKVLAMGREIITGNKSLEEHYSSINSILKRIDRQIIILLDDLDRLEGEEILNTMKLMRTLSDFNNVIFIAGYDRQYVLKSISKPKDNYIDKVFNVEINLLPFDENLILQELLVEIEKIPSPKNTNVDDSTLLEVFKSLFDDHPFAINIDTLISSPCTQENLSYSDFLETLRDVKRFVNEFRFNIDFLETPSDVILSEYILLRLLTYKYRYVQELILNKMETILFKGKIDWVNREIKEGNGFYHDVWIYTHEKKIIGKDIHDNPIYMISSKEKLKELLSKNAKIDDFEVINAGLCRLFKMKSLEFYETHQNSISKTYYTNLYIRNNIASGNITLSQIQKAFETNKLHELVHMIGINPDYKEFSIQNELKYFVFRTKPQNREQFEDLILSLNIFMSDGTHSDDEKVLAILKNGVETFYPNQRNDFVEFLGNVLSISSIGYLDRLFSGINHNLKRKEVGENYPGGYIKYNNNFFSNELKALLLHKLKALINKKAETNEVLEAYHLITEKITPQQTIIRPFEANTLLREEIERDFLKYYDTPLFQMISDKADNREAEFRGYKPNDFLNQIFASQSAYKKLVGQISNPTAFEELEKDGLDNLISFMESIQKSFSEPDNIRIENTIKTLKKYVEKGFKSLNQKEYDEIWGHKN
ncbi:KAP family P-loop NTPase fold protein [Flagellimonas lutimaris]|uniref:KAP family P-loop NTPase fold protein n=1 Tax=Flagellimonas lutimaris TaxID=475082 RepID=UPI003F5CC10E